MSSEEQERVRQIQAHVGDFFKWNPLTKTCEPMRSPDSDDASLQVVESDLGWGASRGGCGDD
jgi:hypothetical protein